MKGKIVYKFKGKEVVFNTETNDLNGNQMFWFDGINLMYYGSKRSVNSNIEHIRNDYDVIEDSVR